jgi:CheY-like chemotaxis protein
MAKSGPIILIDDDNDDVEIMIEVLKEIGISNKLINFTSGPEAFKYLKTSEEQPFIIICDVNLPGETGIELKKEMDNDPQLRQKSIPFIFYSTSVNQHAVNEAYTKMTVQGFFKKGNNFTEIKKIISLINDYWKLCKHPNTQ